MTETEIDGIKIPQEYQDNGVKQMSYIEQEKSKIEHEKRNPKKTDEETLNKQIETEKLAKENANKNKQKSPEEIKAEEIAKEEAKNNEGKFSFDDFKDVKEYKTLEEIKADLKSGEITKSEYNKLKTEFDELKNKVPENPFNDENLYRLDKLKKDKPEDFETYIDVLYNKKSGIELLKMDFVREHPEYKDKMDKVEKLIKRQYGLDEPLPEPEDEEYNNKKEDRDIALMKLDLDAKKVSEKFLKDLNEIKVPEKVDSEKIKKEQEEKISETKKVYREKWSPIVKEFIKGFDKFPIHLPTKEGDKPKLLMEFDVPAELRTKYEENITNFLVERMLPFEKESIDLAKSYLQSDFILTNLPVLFQSAVDYARSIKDEDWAKEVYNPSALKDKTKEYSSTGKEAHNEEEEKRAIEFWKNK